MNNFYTLGQIYYRYNNYEYNKIDKSFLLSIYDFFLAEWYA